MFLPIFWEGLKRRIFLPMFFMVATKIATHFAQSVIPTTWRKPILPSERQEGTELTPWSEVSSPGWEPFSSEMGGGNFVGRLC